MDTTLSDPLVDKLLDGRYAIESRLARGGMASVYLATDIRLERKVAVKVMHSAMAEDPEFVARFNREARAAARLSHPAVVSVYDQGTDDGHVFLVMEYVAGGTLRQVLREYGRLTPAEAAAVMDHVLAALEAAHTAGLIHRDVKPENVLVTPDGRVKVADFGLARAVAGSTVTRDDTTLLGTASYISPEQVQDGLADARSDVYAAGVMFFELLTGTTPFTADTPLAVAYRHLNDDVPAPSTRASGIPRELDEVVGRATRRDPQGRYADGGEFHAALGQARDQLGLHGAVPVPPVDNTVNLARTTAVSLVPDGNRTVALPPEPPAKAKAKKDRRDQPRRWPFILVALLVLSAVAGVGGWWLAVGRYTHAPSVLGLSYDKAAAKLDDSGLHARRGTPIFSDTINRGLVATQDPGADARVHRGATITLRVSAGPAHVDVPNIGGDKVKVAIAALSKANLGVGDRRQVYSTSVAAGRIISTDPAAGTSVPAGSNVNLVISQGPRPVQMPDVTNKPYDEAASILTGVGLEPSRSDVYSDTVEPGKVVTTQPAPGATAHEGQTVIVQVSKGPQPVRVPDVVGDKSDDARKLLEAAGFHVDERKFPGGPDQVLRQSPPGGTLAPRGSTVVLYVF